MGNFEIIYQSYGLDPKSLKKLNVLLKTDYDTLDGLVRIILFKLFTESYGMPESYASHVIPEAQPALDLLAQVLEADTLTDVSISILNRKYVVYPSDSEGAFTAVDLEDFSKISNEELEQACPIPITIDTISLTGIVTGIAIPCLEQVAAMSETQPPENQPDDSV